MFFNFVAKLSTLSKWKVCEILTCFKIKIEFNYEDDKATPYILFA